MTRRRRRALPRMAVLTALCALGAGVYFLVLAPVLHTTGAPAAAVASAPPPRPAGLPKAIPAWAFRLDAWHTKAPGERGARPQGVPRTIPDWYWTWHTWRSRLRSAAAADRS